MKRVKKNFKNYNYRSLATYSFRKGRVYFQLKHGHHHAAAIHGRLNANEIRRTCGQEEFGLSPFQIYRTLRNKGSVVAVYSVAYNSGA